ncbi:MAG: energy transducer TonB [bacterium]
MKLNLIFSFSLHIFLFAVLFISRPGSRKFEGYPTVIPVELVKIEPVIYKAPEVARIAPRPQTIKPKPEKLEGVIIEKKMPEKEETREEPEKLKITEKPKEGKSAVAGEKVRLDVKEFPFSYYLALLQSRIQSNWEPPYQTSRVAISKKAIIYFKIERSGRITDLVVEKGSGDYLYDQAALRAVTLANPLPPLPYDFPERVLGVHFEFEQGT